MKTPEEMLNGSVAIIYGERIIVESVALLCIKQAQKEAYNEAIEDVKKEKYNCEIALLTLTNEDIEKLKKL
jgi:hypothetical protein